MFSVTNYYLTIMAQQYYNLLKQDKGTVAARMQVFLKGHEIDLWIKKGSDYLFLNTHLY